MSSVADIGPSPAYYLRTDANGHEQPSSWQIPAGLGRFNPTNLLGLQAGGADDRIANATERTAKGIDGLRHDVRNYRAAFSSGARNAIKQKGS